MEKNREKIRELLKGKGFDDIWIEDMLNSNYVKWKLMDISSTGGELSSLANELSEKYFSLIPTDIDETKTDYGSVGDGDVKSKTGIISTALKAFGTILNLTEYDKEKREELNRQNEIVLRGYSTIQ